MTWDYIKGEVHITMPWYVAKALHHLQHKNSTKMQHQPHPHAPPNYESKTQYATPLNDSKPLYKEGKKFIIRVTVTFLYYTRAVYGIFLAALSAITLEQSAPT